MKNSYTNKEQYYSDYLGLDKILDAQFPESTARGIYAHDEMLFIIVHQAYELWFKQIRYELSSVIDIFKEKRINDNSAALQTVTHRVNRVVEIWKLLVDQVRVMETMSSMDFLDFRDLLVPASGFQSFQFRVLEAMLGLKMENRHQQKHYRTQLEQQHIDLIRKTEADSSLFELLDAWLARIPFWNVEKYWANYNVPEGAEKELHPFWATYKHIYTESLQSTERKTIGAKVFEDCFFGSEDRKIRLSPGSCQAALFIMLYREYPLLQLPYQLLSKLLEIDELMANWRYRHMIMVRRVIGLRSGTGGSSGAEYLSGAMLKHHIFGDFANLVTFLVPRYQRPILPKGLADNLKFRDV